MCMGVDVSSNFMDIVVNGNHIAIAVVIAIGLCWQKLCLEILWQMLLPTSIIFVWQMEGHCGRCYGHMLFK